MTEPSTRAAIVAGHTGDATTAREALGATEPSTRAAGLGALDRLGALTSHDLDAALIDPAPTVRRRAAQLAAVHPAVDLSGALTDDEPLVVEMAAWACGERETVPAEVSERLVFLATDADDPLVREAAVAALGAIGDDATVGTIIAACSDKPTIRRRAVLALAPFVDRDDAMAAIERAGTDRDWQVRQAAEDLLRAVGLDAPERPDQRSNV